MGLLIRCTEYFSHDYIPVNLVWWSVCPVFMINWPFTLDLRSERKVLSVCHPVQQNCLLRVQGELSSWHSSPLRPWQNQSQDTLWFLYPTFIPNQNACPGLDPVVAHHDRMEHSRPNTTLQQRESVLFNTSLKVFAPTLKWKFNNYSALKPGIVILEAKLLKCAVISETTHKGLMQNVSV